MVNFGPELVEELEKVRVHRQVAVELSVKSEKVDVLYSYNLILILLYLF